MNIKKLMFVLVMICAITSTTAQIHDNCGSHLSKSESIELDKSQQTWRISKSSQKISGTEPILAYPVHFHIIRKNDGTGGLDQNLIQPALDHVNEVYMNMNIYFYLCGVSYVDDDTYYDYDRDVDNESGLCDANDVDNVLNVYCSNSLTDGAITYCGLAYYPTSSLPKKNRLFMDNNCVPDGSTLRHEFGHSFGLRHTHNGGNELVDGTNCSTAGDNFCDTEADPQLSYVNVKVSQACEYVGTATDANGQAYNPPISNIMSYSPKECYFVKDFSAEQYAYMRFMAETRRATGYSCPTVALESKFHQDFQHTCDNTLAVQLCDISTGTPSSWLWDFGDGNTSTAQNPSHTYTSPGSYDISLTVSDGANNDVLTKNSQVKVGAVSVPYSNDFESADALDDFKIWNGFENITTLEGDGGNGGTAGMVFQQNENGDTWPRFYYSSALTADVFDEHQNPAYKSSATLCVDATNLQTLQLDFDYSMLRNSGNYFTNFRVLINDTEFKRYVLSGSDIPWTNESLNLDAYVGGVVEIKFEGCHKFIRDYNGVDDSGTATLIDNINITGNSSLTADFIVDKTSDCLNGNTFTFTDASSGTLTSWFWDFGTGATPATANGQGPHNVNYSTVGNKNVQLTISDGTGTDIETKSSFISVNDIPSGTASIGGATSVCENTTNENYVIAGVTGATTFTWTANNGAVIVGGQGTSTISLDFGNSASDIVVTASNSCGNATDGNLTVTIDNSPCIDCNGELHGTAYMDNCGSCVDGNTGNVACSQDCNGDWGGTASIDLCGACSGGATGVTPNTTCTQDCNGDWGGSAAVDNCGVCAGGNTGVVACTQDCNGDWGGTAFIDGCGVCVEGNTGATACPVDCNGDLGGSAYTDNCGNCVDGLTGNVACTQDCNGEWGGTAAVDLCGNCSGGSTGITACVGLIQGESYCSIEGGSDDLSPGYQGAGYATFDNNSSALGAWAINSGTSQTITLTIVYSNGDASNRDLVLSIDDVVQGVVSCPSTGGWSNWATTTISITLNSGDNFLTLLTQNTSGGPYIDYLSWVDSGISAGNCSNHCPIVDLGLNTELCTITSVNLDVNATWPDISYIWTKDDVNTGNTSGATVVTSAGDYAVTVIAPGCADQSDNVNITSLLPEVDHDTICSSGTVNLGVIGTGSYEWYATNNSVTSLNSGDNYSTTITNTTTYYVEDVSSFSTNVGPSIGLGNYQDHGVASSYQLAFTVYQDFTLNSFKIPCDYWSPSGTMTVEIFDQNGNSFVPAKQFTCDPISIGTNGNNQLIQFDFTGFDIKASWGTNLRMGIISKNGGLNTNFKFSASGAAYNYQDGTGGTVVEITSSYQGGNEQPNYYMYFYDWDISSGTACSRVEVTGVVDPGECSVDCNGDAGGTAYIDNCGTCVDGNTGNVACTQDCNGDWGGSAVIDNCGVCTGGNSGNVACTQDCNGDWGGSAVLDNCGACTGGNSGNVACTQDCNGDWGGSAVLDNCGSCTGGNSGNVACTQDCNGDWGGSAVIDNCGACTGGNSGNVACAQDCNGDWGGTAVLDNCGSCTGGNSGNIACTQDCNGDWGGSADLDNCGACTGGNSGNVACTQDCNGDWGGSAVIDNCGACTGGNSGNVACTQDCNGDWGGTANIDVCNVCAGGNTGVTPGGTCGLVVDFTVSDFEVCEGESIVFTDATSNTNGTESYNWSFGNGASISNSTERGPHSVVYTSTGIKTIRLDVSNVSSSGFKEINITVHGLPNTSIIGPNQAECGESNVAYSVVDNPGSIYNWSATNATLQTGQSTANVTYTFTTTNAVLTVVEVDQNNCVGPSAVYPVNVCNITSLTGINAGAITIYPNPTDRIINIECSSEEDWTLLDLTGHILKTGSSSKVDIESYKAGVYILKIRDQIFKVLKE